MAKSKPRPELKQTPIVDALPAACADERSAVQFLEAQRWAECPCCPECGSVSVYIMRNRAGERSARFLWRCRDCEKMYTVRTGTVYAESLIPLHKWLRALWESSTAKNGASALKMSRRLQISYKSALFLMHRIRHAMADGPGPLPKLRGTVEMDETYVGGKPRFRMPRKGPGRLTAPKNRRGRGAANKSPVVAVVQRGGDVRTRVVPAVTAENLGAVLRENVERGARINTDDFLSYRRICREPGDHRIVRHSYGEYVSRIDPSVHTNTVEGFFSRVKRQLMGTYHAVSREHLHRYINHSAFLYNTRGMNDGERAAELMRRTVGKRLHYREPQRLAG